MTIIKKVSLAGALLLGTAGIAAAAPATVVSDLNLRAGPGTNYSVVAVLPGGTGVDLRDCSGNWCRVAAGGYSGYASRSYLDVGGGTYAAAPVYGPVYEEPYYGGPYYAGYGGPIFGFGFGGWHHGWRGGGWHGGWHGHHGGHHH